MRVGVVNECAHLEPLIEQALRRITAGLAGGSGH
jgi:hypothetical protein